jgi:topoisomerase-4 subunit A
VSIIFAGKHQKRDAETIDAQEFIASKSYRAKGKRVTTFEVGHISFVEPLIKESIDNNVQEEPPLEQQDSEDKDISPTLF